MYRYAARHHLELSYFGGSSVTNLRSAANETKQNGQRVDLMHYHISPRGQYMGTWNEAVTHYRVIMRNPDDINFITVLREPRSHLLSYYYYFLQPLHQQSIEEFLLSGHRNNNEHRMLYNPLSAEFGVRTAEEMDSFISSALPDFKLVLLAERLDEGLLTLGRMLHWHMIDLTYCDLNETKEGSRRWDGKTVVTRPQFDSLPKQVRNKIDDLTRLDRVLYEAGKNEFEKRMAPYASSVQEDIPQFQELQGVIKEYLNGNSSSLAYQMYLNVHIYKKRLDNYLF
ncbi:unnamed protein product [Ectocarpus sp. CCAP 1310/34]|nr:unnamed protein product [Ectocarpus sp. CCAP 1310/34]